MQDYSLFYIRNDQVFNDYARLLKAGTNKF